MNCFVRPIKNRTKNLISAIFALINVRVVWEEYSAESGLNSKRFLIIRGFEGPSLIGSKHYINRKRIIKNFSSTDKFTSYTNRIVDGTGANRVPISIVEAAVVADGAFEVYKKISIRKVKRNLLVCNGNRVTVLPLGFDHFGHFIYQVLPLFLKKSNYTFAMSVVTKNDKNRILEILDFFDVSYKFIDTRTKPLRIQLAAKQDGLYPGLSAAKLMSHRISAKLSESTQDKYIFLTRRNAPQGRSAINETQLIDELKGFNFEIVDSGTLSFSDQMSLFSSSKVVIGAHGSALANIIGMKNGSTIIELAGERYVRWHVKKLAADMGIRHSLLICESDENDNFHVNMTEFRKILKESLEYTQV